MKMLIPVFRFTFFVCPSVIRGYSWQADRLELMRSDESELDIVERHTSELTWTVLCNILRYGAFLRSRYFLLAARYVDGVHSSRLTSQR